MAWAPPTQYTSPIPATAAAASVSSATRPDGPGGTHSASSGTPATLAGAAPMSTVDG